MKMSFRLVLVLALLAGGMSLSVAACDSLRSSAAKKGVQATAKSTDAVVYVKGSNAAILESQKEELKARFEKTVKVAKRGSGETLTSMEDVSLKYATNPSRIVARAKDASGNCLLTSFRLEESDVSSSASTQSTSDVNYMTLVGTSNTCTGDPCNLCEELYNQDGEFQGCNCAGEGPNGGDGFCNHSTTTPGEGE